MAVKPPTVYRSKTGPVEIRLMDDKHLYLAWRWWAEHRDTDYADAVYRALQAEKVRRRDLRRKEKEKDFDGP